MSKLFIEDTSLVALGDAIRAKTGKSAKLTPAQMASEIGSITTGGGGGSSSGLPTPPEGGWNYGTSPWHWYCHTTTSVTNDYWVFDVSNCTSLTITWNFIPGDNAATGYTNTFGYAPHYGYLVEWGDKVPTARNRAGVSTKIDDTARVGGEKYVVTKSASEATGTATFDVTNYTILTLQVFLYSATYSSAAAIYISDISYS
jgi:hypothetical protein